MPTTPSLSVVVAEPRPGALRREFFDVLAPEIRRGTVEVIVASTTDPVHERVAPADTRWVECQPHWTVPRRRAAGRAAGEARRRAITPISPPKPHRHISRRASCPH